MAISRGLQPRQLYGLGSLVKSVTKGVKSAVKGVAKTVKKNPLLAAAAFNFAPMAFGKSPFLGLGSLKGSMGTLFGGAEKGIFNTAKNFFTGGSDLANTAKIFAGGSLLGGLLNQAEEEGDPEGITRDVGALRSKLINAYKNQRTFSDAADEDTAILEQVDIDLSEYNQDMNRANAAYGGRIGYAGGRIGFFKGAVAGGGNISPGTDVKGNVRNDNPFTGGGGGGNNNPPPVVTPVNKPDIEEGYNFSNILPGGKPFYASKYLDYENIFGTKYNPITGEPIDESEDESELVDIIRGGIDLKNRINKTGEIISKMNMANGGRIGYAGGTEFEEYLKGREEFNKKQNAEQLYKEFLENKRRQKVAEQKTMAANGGRIGFARGPDNPEQNAIQAAGIMNLPLNQNPAGVTELDLRETGGFIPPVGVKEKADDIPAMLANNEFVFTADAVRGMGAGDVNKGAQRMYDMMKKLEKGGRV